MRLLSGSMGLCGGVFAASYWCRVESSRMNGWMVARARCVCRVVQAKLSMQGTQLPSPVPDQCQSTHYPGLGPGSDVMIILSS